jgi:hypothetical protein
MRKNLATDDASAERQSGAPWRHGCTAESWLVMHLLRISGRLEYLRHCREVALARDVATCGVLCAGHTPTIADLETLTIESRDIEDLKECVVGNRKIKL